MGLLLQVILAVPYLGRVVVRTAPDQDRDRPGPFSSDSGTNDSSSPAVWHGAQ